MAAVTTAAVGIGLSAYSAKRGRSAQKKSQRSQDEAMAAQREMSERQMGFAHDQYEQWQDMFQPVLGDLKTMAYESTEPDYAAIGADVGAAFDSSQQINRRQQQRFGFAPSDGAVQDGEVQYGLGRAQAMVDARNRARVSNQDQQYNRLAGFYQMGSGMGQQAAGMVQAAYAGAGGMYGQQAGVHGQQANQYGQQVQGSMQDAAGWAGWGMDQWQNRSKPAASTPPDTDGGGT